MIQSRLKELIEYREGRFYRIGKGPLVVTTVASGYQKVWLDGESLLFHRIVFLYFHGYLPSSVDHINRVKNDNRIENLRDASRTQNQGNRGLDKNNKSGFKGVCWRKDHNRWQAYIHKSGKRYSLGYFTEKEDAAMAYNEAALEYFGEFAVLNCSEAL